MDDKVWDGILSWELFVPGIPVINHCPRPQTVGDIVSGAAEGIPVQFGP